MKGEGEGSLSPSFVSDEIPVDAGRREQPWPCTDPKVKSFADADSGRRMQANALRPWRQHPVTPQNLA